MAEDYGGPQRKFFRLLMIEVQTTMGVLEGNPGNMLFTYNQQAFMANKYYTAGKLAAWAISHNGPSLRCLNAQLYDLMCGQKPSLTNFDVDIFLDEEISRNLHMINACTTEADMAKVKREIGDWIASCGVPSIFSSSVEEKSDVHDKIVTHFLYHRVASMINQFIAGMNACGDFWVMVKSNWRQFKKLFVGASEKLTRLYMKDLLVVDWSPRGSINRRKEEATIFLWLWWLTEVEVGETPFTFEDVLVFFTGADCVPPLGFQKSCSINFFDNEPGERRLPYSSTCSLTLFLPRGVKEEQEFASLMDTTLHGYLGFGKA